MSFVGIHSLVRRQVELTPDAEAFRFRGKAFTFREVEDRANRLAHLLTGLGARRGDRIGVCLERGPDLVAGILAGLKVGGCFVPLDPAYPAPRLSFLASDSAVRTILTTRELGQSLFGGHDVELICLDEHDLDALPAECVDVPVSPLDLAYLIYTSGSTGVPKGVAIEHRTAVKFFDWVLATFDDEERHGMLASSSVCFDVVLFEILSPLATGGRFLLVQDVLELDEMEPDDGVILLNAVPSAISELINAGIVPTSVRTVCMGGEAVDEQLVRAVAGLPHVTRALNQYGPSEDTTYSTWAELLPVQAGRQTIGNLLPGKRGYILDEYLNEVPQGEEGELYLAGAGLAQGYLSRPGPTAAKFLPDPFATAPGERMYRTGDRVRVREDGQLDFVGRVDDQVKVRGFRIELGEVTAALMAAPGVRHASARVMTAPAGDSRLVGYLLPTDDSARDRDEVRRFLLERLPKHLVPTELVWMKRFPLTASGKVDRNALPSPWPDEIQAAVRAAWRDVLGAEPGAEDDFFTVGGDSLTATLMVSRLSTALGAHLAIDAVFNHPTVAELCRHLRTVPKGDPPAVSEVEAGALTFAQERLWIAHQLDPDDVSYLVSCVIEIDGGARIAPLRQAVEDVVARHEALHTVFESPEDEPVPVRRPGLSLDLQEIVGTDLRAAAASPMDLARGPLTRWRIVRDGERASAVVFVAHHIVFDAWSLELLVADLGRCYDDRAAGRSPRPLQPAAACFGTRQRLWLSGPDGQAALRNLADSLAGAPGLLDLPTDFPRPPQRGPAGARLLAPLDPAILRAAQQLGRAHHSSAFMVGAAAFAALLADWSGHRDVVLGAAFAGRTSVEAEQTIGNFVNTVPLRLRAPADASFLDLLADSRRASLFAAAHQDVPFQALVGRLAPARSAAYDPLVQVAFGVQSGGRPSYDGEVRMRARTLDVDDARLDLTLWLTDRVDGGQALWSYRTDLFRAETIAALHERYARWLAAIVAEPHLSLAKLAALAAPAVSA